MSSSSSSLPNSSPQGDNDDDAIQAADEAADRRVELTAVQSTLDREASREISLASGEPPGTADGYAIDRCVGRGSFGSVWLGWDRNTGRRVAIKFFLNRRGLNWEWLRREVDGLVAMDADRGVVQILEVGWDGRPPYIVMEWIDGGSLADRLDPDQKLPPSEVVELMKQILVALGGCHRRGVLHCDLKPANILIDDDGAPRIADFGQSRLASDQSSSLGTLFYMAPEQAVLDGSTPNRAVGSDPDVDTQRADSGSTSRVAGGGVPDARHDIYAVGAIAYRMLMGRPPHRDSIGEATLDASRPLDERLRSYRRHILAAGPPVDHRDAAGIDRRLADIVTRCLQPDPERRYGDVSSVLSDLRRRQTIRGRRPLILTGLLGPILIAIATMVFFVRTFNAARQQSVAALRTEARTANRMAAAFAAASMESQLSDYFAAVDAESKRIEFRDALTQLLESDVVEQSREAIARRRIPAATAVTNDARTALTQSAAATSMVNQLGEAMKRLTRRGGSDVATLFISDSVGTTLAIAYADEDAIADQSDTAAGRNFCYRTYFHGGPADLSPQHVVIGEVLPVDMMHLSVPFRSTATGLWKIAISVPIRTGGPSTSISDGGQLAPAEDDDAFSDANNKPGQVAPATRPKGIDTGPKVVDTVTKGVDTESNGVDLGPKGVDAVLVATVNLGDLKLLSREATASQFATLVDVRPGPTRGTILQHPAMSAAADGDNASDASGRRVADRRARRIEPAVLRAIASGGDVDYRDPFDTPNSDVESDRRGSDPRQTEPRFDDRPSTDVRWIATTQPVRLPATDADDSRPAAGWMVMVQYRLADVLRPVDALGRTLLIEALAGLASILIVVAATWWLVRRLGTQR